MEREAKPTMEKNAYLMQKRTERLSALIGKWIVIADNSKNPGTILYFQDPDLAPKSADGKQYNWTRYMVNAKGFDSESDARIVAGFFQYGNARVAHV